MAAHLVFNKTSNLGGRAFYLPVDYLLGHTAQATLNNRLTTHCADLIYADVSMSTSNLAGSPADQRLKNDSHIQQ